MSHVLSIVFPTVSIFERRLMWRLGNVFEASRGTMTILATREAGDRASLRLAHGINGSGAKTAAPGNCPGTLFAVLLCGRLDGLEHVHLDVFPGDLAFD
jgi:hypothetical protein